MNSEDTIKTYGSLRLHESVYYYEAWLEKIQSLAPWVDVQDKYDIGTIFSISLLIWDVLAEVLVQNTEHAGRP